MNYIISLLPVFGWGFMPIIANLKKSKPEEQLLGTSISALFFSILLYIIVQPHITFFSFIISFLSGVFWSLGQLFQFKAISVSSVSKTMPLSNGTQLIGTTLFAVFVFHEWNTLKATLIGTIAIGIIIAGIYITNYVEKSYKVQHSLSLHTFSFVITSSFFLTLYVITNQLFSITGYSIIFPQAIGMFTGAILINYLNKQNKASRSSVSFNLLTGLSWSIGNLGMFLATASLGIGTSFSISQACVIVSTIGGIIIFKEGKSRKEWAVILTGIIVIMLGVFLLGVLKQ
nr:GRP family sugar transporter [Paraliobacillus salinarum]